MKISKEQICMMFNCTMEQLNTQYAYNAKTLASMRDKAKNTNKKVNGYTFDKLATMTSKYELLSK